MKKRRCTALIALLCAAITVFCFAACETKTGYDANFECNGGSAVEKMVNVKQIESEPLTEKEGHTFLGWYDNAEYTGARIAFPYQLSENTTLYAKWEEIVYDVTFVTDGGSVVEKLVGVKQIEEEPLSEKEGYTFLGWYDNAEYTGARIVFPYQLNENTTLYAKWEEIVYDVTFVTDGGSAVEKLVGVKQIESEPLTEKEGYTFLGWYDNAEYTGERIAFPYQLKENTTLYAKWEEIVYDVTFVTDGGSVVEKLVGVKQIEEEPLSEKEGYTFLGWYDNAEYTGARIVFPYQLNENTTLYAKWEEIVYDVTFVTDGGSAVEKLVGVKQIESEPLTEKEGYTFLGWYDNAEYTGARIAFPYQLSENTTLYAKWEEIVYDVTFVTDGGNAVEKLVGVKQIDTEPVSEKEGYRFVGWYLTEDCSGEKVVFPYELSQNVTLYANWEKVFAVTTVVSGVDDQTYLVAAGSILEQPEAPSRVHYAFDGWYEDAAMSQEAVFGVPVTSDIKLYGDLMQEADVALFVMEDTSQYVDLGYQSYCIAGLADGVEQLPEKLVIPSSYRDCPVSVILGGPFQNHTEIRYAYIPDSVKILDDSVFSGCTDLAKVRMSRTLQECGSGTFYNTQLYNEAPDGIFYVGSVLAGFKGTTPDNMVVNVKEGTRVIADRVWWLNKKVVEVNLPASLVYVGFNAFLEAPVVSYSVAEESETYAVQDGALFSKDMTHLVYYPVGNTRTEYEIPSTVESIGDEAFCNAYYLTRVVIPDSVKVIGDGVFDMSEKLEEVVFGAGIVKVGDGVLHSQRALKRIIVKAATPFEFGVYFLSGAGTPNYEIYIEDAYLQTYQSAAGWSSAASRMKPLSQLNAA